MKKIFLLSILLLSSISNASDFLNSKENYNDAQVAFDDGRSQDAKNFLKLVDHPVMTFFKKDLMADMAFNENDFKMALELYLEAIAEIEKDNLELKEVLLNKIQYTKQKIKKQ